MEKELESSLLPAPGPASYAREDALSLLFLLL